MLFNSFEFIFVFLPITLVGYFMAGWLAPPIVRLLWLTAASLVFYAYWDYHFLFIIGMSIILNYCFGRVISVLPRNDIERLGVFILAVAVNLAAIGFYKYANFGIDIVSTLLGKNIPALSVALPLGISFFTFTQIAYLADVYRGYKRETSLVKYALFVSYFPHLIAGPILHHGEMMPQFGQAAGRYISAERFAVGLTTFVIGLFKKAVIADGFSLLANPVFKAANHGAIPSMDAWVGALAYSLQIYFDFSGYSDMAVGLSCLFGIVLPFNFDAPYKSRSIIEFWRRWHITLSRFLRDYLYIPLGGNRKGEVRQNVNLLVTMLLGGLWHGANWTYVIWGGLHGLYLLINHAWGKTTRGSPWLTRASRTTWYAILALLLTQLCVAFAWVFFRADSLQSAWWIVAAMVHLRHDHAAGVKSALGGGDLAVIGVFYLGCFSLPNVNALFDRWNLGFDTYRMPRPWSVLKLRWQPTTRWAIGSAALLLTSLLIILIAGDGTQFLYFQF